ncbi:hypothetical protein [Paraflavitalea speifideaquila]|uniref:hypothetical protein n=1 Tax=Paraflavitalea speifideaquila TaxID=3076558 RepID=UPI0028EC863B|nr:hypothetical protein [Paraflavitalea speifideiaquila]
MRRTFAAQQQGYKHSIYLLVMFMKRNWTKYIIGYFLITAFLCNDIVPELMILTGRVSHSIVNETMAVQEDANTERSTEEAQGDARTDYLPCAHSSDYIHQAPLFLLPIMLFPAILPTGKLW